jgi:hypothetical protein
MEAGITGHMRTKQEILEEIKRTAKENGGQPEAWLDLKAKPGSNPTIARSFGLALGMRS